MLAGRVAVPIAFGSFFPVLLAAAFLLPPYAAALAAVPGALISHAEERAAPRCAALWRAAQLAIAVAAAATAHVLLGGRAALGGSGPATLPDFPYVLLPAGAAALVFCLVLTALDGLILATAERLPARTAWRGILLRSLAPHCVHGLAGLMMAVLWRSPFGPPAALFVLLPMYISCWVFAQYHRERAAHQATIRALVQAVDIKDRYTRGHSERVGRASEMIARELGMAEGRLEVLRFAGILHDVGKLGVPTRVLRKDGPLTPEERRGDRTASRVRPRDGARHRLPRRGPRGDPAPPRAARRERLPLRSGRRPDPRGGPGRGGGRRVRRDDVDALLPPGPARRGRGRRTGAVCGRAVRPA